MYSAYESLFNIKIQTKFVFFLILDNPIGIVFSNCKLLNACVYSNQRKFGAIIQYTCMEKGRGLSEILIIYWAELFVYIKLIDLISNYVLRDFPQSFKLSKVFFIG